MSIHQEVEFQTSPERIYQALMNEKEHAAFTGSPAKISGDAGGAFSCHDGQILGRNIELVENQRIVQAWRVAAWEPGVYSVVKMSFEKKGAKTKLVLDHSGVPDAAAEMIEAGWKVRYWEPLEKYLTK